MSTITPKYRTVRELLQGQSFAIDEYQREYKWERENIEELLADFLDKFRNCYQPGDDTKAVSNYEDYFLGSIIVSKRSGKHYLVDGQQRITSLTLLLIYLHHAAEEKGLPVSTNIKPLIYSDDFGIYRFNLDIEESLPAIEALFRKTPFNPQGYNESIQNMHSRYQDIEAFDLVGELGGELVHFCYWLMEKVGLIEISTDNDSYAYAIFETMNDRGKPISPVDMLKAYLLAFIQDTDKRRQANQVWRKQVLDLITWGGAHEPERDANCIKAWFRAQYAASIRERKAGSTDKDWELVGTVFHRWARENREVLSICNEAQNLKMINTHFPFFAKAYRTVLEASRNYTPGLEPVFYNAHNAFTWQITVLLAPLNVEDDEDTQRRKMAATATYLDIWLMRRVFNYIRVGYSSSNYAMYLLCNEIRRKPLRELVDILTQRLANDDVTVDECSYKDRRGIDDWRLNQFSRRYIYHMLARVTAFVETASGRPDMFDNYVDRDTKNPFDVEHLWANDFSRYADAFKDNEEFQHWRNHVAGLVLLPADVNRSYQGKPFEEKAPHYAKQNLYAASLTPAAYAHQPQFSQFCKSTGLPFKGYTTFGKDEQSERRALLKALVNMVWSPERLKRYLPKGTDGV